MRWISVSHSFCRTLFQKSDCNNPLLFHKGAHDCLCFRRSCCIALNTPAKGCGLTTDKDRGECCKIGCFFFDFGLIWPTKFCGGAEQCLCFYHVCNFPCSREFIPAPVCTLLPFCQCCPKCGCCVTPPPCPALDKVLKNELLPVTSQRIYRGYTTAPDIFTTNEIKAVTTTTVYADDTATETSTLIESWPKLKS